MKKLIFLITLIFISSAIFSQTLETSSKTGKANTKTVKASSKTAKAQAKADARAARARAKAAKADAKAAKANAKVVKANAKAKKANVKATKLSAKTSKTNTKTTTLNTKTSKTTKTNKKVTKLSTNTSKTSSKPVKLSTQKAKPQLQEKEVNGPKIKFNKTTHNYGEIYTGSDGKCVFEFTNTGNEPLILTKPRSSCGCTVPTWPREPILPGESNKIVVTYNTHHNGSFNKTVTVYSNAVNNKNVVLRIKGKVVPKPKDDLPVKDSKGKLPENK